MWRRRRRQRHGLVSKLPTLLGRRVVGGRGRRVRTAQRSCAPSSVEGRRQLGLVGGSVCRLQNNPSHQKKFASVNFRVKNRGVTVWVRHT